MSLELKTCEHPPHPYNDSNNKIKSLFWTCHNSICKIMTWSDHCFLSKSNANCDKIWMVRWWTVLWNVSLPCLSCYLLMDMGTSPCLSLRTWLINDWDCHLWHILLTQFNWNQCIYINWNQGTHTHIYISVCKKNSSMITNPCPNFLGCLVTEDMISYWRVITSHSLDCEIWIFIHVLFQ